MWIFELELQFSYDFNPEVYDFSHYRIHSHNYTCLCWLIIMTSISLLGRQNLVSHMLNVQESQKNIALTL